MATIEKYTLGDGQTRYQVRYRKPDRKQTKRLMAKRETRGTNRKW